MPILYRADAKTEEGYLGIPRTILVDAIHGAKSLWVGHLEIAPGAMVTTHIHPDTEEAMVIVEGQLEAVLGDEVVTLAPGDTVLAPAGVKHGFVTPFRRQCGAPGLFSKYNVPAGGGRLVSDLF